MRRYTLNEDIGSLKAGSTHTAVEITGGGMGGAAELERLLRAGKVTAAAAPEPEEKKPPAK